MPESSPVSTRKVQQALTYLAALNSDDPERVQQARGQLERWRGKSSEHERAWQEAEQRWQLVHRLTPQLRTAVAPEPLNISRRRLLRQGGGLLVAVAGASWLGWLWRRTPQFDRLLQTVHAEPPRREILPDGSQLLLAAESSLRIEYSNGVRQVRLLHGNVYFDVARERLRPFLISTRLGEVQVLGTAFSVSDRGGEIQIAVARGRVEVRGLREGSQVLQAGERISLDAQGRLLPLRADPHATASLQHWQRGWWSFTDAPLVEVIAELNAYALQPVTLAADAAQLHLTGSFPSDQPEMLLQTLPKILPVSLVQHGQQRTLQRR
ncbi:FecR domain-containing protein [Pseudomonas wadenswilerensis]|jgi:transmembrane sensor|uniref:Protein FecR n=1 Tax=Pseudomonas wadenswilerensis TaxID=1785161 RepID=A0A380SX21_9PSED|nr:MULTISPECIES: FecR domain-containing protein [Pseudomonas]MCE5982173.1 FecR domain-containing protein [Pseudomonas sp. LF19]UVM20927.1 FecR domain-containing protein [Pseudomonas wadenswilerensis]SPO65383.1 putative FecR-like transmembrane sensor [Pseudomonas sp. JV241A]SUQ61828.1 Protein FecR [Pseudomonas wadenswilerensis]